MNFDRLFAPYRPPTTTLADRLGYWAEQTPDRLAFAFWNGDDEQPETRLTFADLQRHAHLIAAELTARGLAGQRALMLYPPGLDFVTALFGCFLARVVAVPAYPPRRNRNMQRIDAIGASAQAAVVLTNEEVITRDALRLDDAPLLRHLPWVATDQVTGESGESTTAAAWNPPPVAPENIALLQYTSGSTGTPKGVVLTHANLIHNCESITLGFEPCRDTGRGLFWLPTYHDMGLVGAVLEPVFLGVSSYLIPPLAFLQNPIRWLRGISRFRATMSGGPNFAYALCVDAITDEQCQGLDLSSWDVAFNGAEPVRADTLEAFTRKFAPYGFRAEMHYPCYGMAEATLIISGGRKQLPPLVKAFDAAALAAHRAVAVENGTLSRQLVGCGRPLADQQVTIVDPDTCRPLPDECVGEIWVAGGSVAQGYWNDREQTEYTFRARLANGASDAEHNSSEHPDNGCASNGALHYLRTGDLGFVHQGELFVTGRSKDLIIIRGRNVYPQDVELTVQHCHSALRDAGGACFAIEGPEGDEHLIVVQELERGTRRDDAGNILAAICSAVLEEHELPLHAVLLLKAGRLPKTSSGKVQRRACREAYLHGELRSFAQWSADLDDSAGNSDNDSRQKRPADILLRSRAAAAEIRDWLVSRIAGRLHRSEDEIDIHAPLVRFGLDSLALVQISGQLADFLGRTVSPVALYNYPTIAELAGHLASPEDESSRAVERQRPVGEPIAVVAVGCRFPMADNPAEFWRLLCDGRDAVTPVPAERWRIDDYYDPNPEAAGKMVARDGGFVRDVDLFDPQFFSIAPREAAAIDPQQRLLLEVAWETLENAGIPPDRLAGEDVGVFVGISNSDYARLQARSGGLGAVDAYTGTGTALSIAAGRLSHVLGVRGPCLSVDTACSSSLAAVHLAVQSLRNQECGAAFAGGVNLVLDPAASVALSRLQALSPDGRCKPFDASANGYVRGEGCGLVLLKRLSDAARDGDRVLAVIRGTAMNHDGRSNGLTAPHGPSQEAVIRAALASAGVAAEDVGYLEAHGTGTSLGDPIEMEAVAKVLCERRDAAHRLVMGSVKSNIGHLESAAGVAGLIKAVLALQHEQIPATLHLEQPNPYIAWSKIPVDVPTDLTPWPESHRRRIAGVSSFGFSGTNVHVVVEQSPQIVAAEAETERHCQMLALSAKDGEALSELAARYAERLQASATSENASDFADVCHTAACGRMHFAHRIALVAKDAAEAVEKLSQFRAGSRAAGVLTGRVDPQRPPKIAFLFSGQGAQYAGMARELFESQPTFRRALALCDEILRDELPHSLLKTLFGEPPAGANGAGSRLDQTLYTQPALFAVEYALYELWRSWGVEPQFLLGHSVGEFVAAVAAEVLSLDDALRLIAARARLMQALPSDGEMTAVAADEPTVRANLGAAAERIDIAALNSPRQTVISGPADAMRDAVVALEESGLPTTRLKVSHAFHSRMMEPVLDEFEQLCRQVKFSPPRIPIASNVHGRIVGDETATPEYWRQQIRRAVRFVEGVTALDASGADVFIEIGPKPLLATAGRQCLADRGQLWLPSLRPGRGDWSQLLESLAELYVRGVEIDWRGFDRDYARRLVDLPNYPFQRARYWFDEPPNGEEVEARRNRAAGAAQPEPSVAKSSGESFHDWLFELQWQPRSRLDQALHRTPPEFVPSAAELRAATDYEAERVREQLELPRYRKLLVELDQLSGAYVWWAFDTLGWRSDELSDDSAEALADRLGVAPTRRRLFGRLLDILAADGHVKRTIRSWAACGLPPPEHPTETADRLLDEYPECAAELTLLGNCGSGLAGVLSGEIDALQLLFPDGSVELVEKLYRDSPFARTLNSLLEETVARVIRDLPAGRTLRILEIGAGTGAATTNLLPRLPADRTEYWFTDVSQVFTREAAGKFRRFPFVRFGVLDIESDTAAQGFAPHQFDLVIAANVLHATRNVRESLAHVRELLVDGGGLVLLEGTRPQRWLDLIFGLTDGWWRFEDRDLRPAHPLISADQWRRSLMECGFAEADVMPAGEFVAVEASASADPAPPQAVVFGRASANHVASAGGEIPPAHAGAAVESNGAAAGDKRSWLILADRSGIGEALAAALRSAGRRVALVQQGDETRAVAAGRHTLRSVEELSRVLTLEGVPHASKLQGVVHLWALDAATPDELTAAKLEQARRLGSESAIALVQQLQPLAGPAGPRLHFVTRGAQPAGDEQRMSGLAQAPLWGVGRVLAEEHPSLWGGLIDLDPALPVDEAARRLCDELLSPDGEDQLALRPHDRFAARLVRRAPHSTAASQLRFRADASYLITGGLGDLGLRTAEWLVEQGVHHLVLLGRTPLPPRERWEKLCRGATRQAAQLRVLLALEARGATVFTAAVDVADETAVSGVLRQLRADGWPPLRGVIQAAGMPDAQPLVEIQPQRLAEIMYSKVSTGWSLHRAVARERLDFFACFASGAGLLGSPLLASYAAANAFVVALAGYRRSQGLPALAIDWGFWENSHHAGLTECVIHEAIVPQGMGMVTTTEGMAALKYLIEVDAVRTAVLPADLDALCLHHARFATSPLLSCLRATETSPAGDVQAAATAGVPGDSPAAALRAASPEGRRDLAEDYLREQIARVLRLTPERVDVHTSLNNLGIDSLMAVELRNHVQASLGVVIPIARLLQEPTVAQLADVVLEQLDDAGESDHAPPVEAAPVTPDAEPPSSAAEEAQESLLTADALAQFDGLTDDEVDAMLRRMLAEEQQQQN